MSDKEIIAYTAGLVDGEGTFWRGYQVNGRGERSLQSRIIVTQKDPEMLIWLKEKHGGGVTRQVKMSFGLMREMHRWSLNGKKAEVLAVKLLPFMITKREQIKRVILK